MVSSLMRESHTPKKEPPLPAALKLITGRRQTEWTGATRCPNEDSASHKRESLTLRKRTVSFRFRLPCLRDAIACQTKHWPSGLEKAVGRVLGTALFGQG